MAKNIESLVEKEIEKGSTPLRFDSLAVSPEGFRDIDSRERLLNVLQYLLRVKEHRKLMWNDTLSSNNVYMDVFLGKADFHRAALITGREEIYQHINWYGGKLKPDYDGKTVIETDICAFSITEDELEKCRKTYEGKDAYSFYFGKYQIRSLYADCLEYRKNMARDEDKFHAADDSSQQADYGKYTELFRLNDDVIRAVLFQCLLLDDLKIENGAVFANLYTIYLLN
ncbi:MAG: hypothetical protein J5943_00065 [Oribacterium sp.]|nr:hypothetical protein [Oribacterium sp.]MBO6310353.1 hypothetical protein [Oribacterium sp.]MBP3806012.1 hypothetical protein [Oribacterium sp.]